MDIRTTFASNLRRQRRAAKLSQEKLAELAGVHRTYIGGIEQQRVNVSLKNIGRIADALGIDPAVLFLREDGAREDAIHDIAMPPSHNDKNTVSYALISWSEENTALTPIDVKYKSLTVQLLCELIERGYTGEELAKKYQDACETMLELLEPADK